MKHLLRFNEAVSMLNLHGDDKYEIEQVIVDEHHDYATVDGIRYELSGNEEEVVNVEDIESTLENTFYEDQINRYIEYFENGGMLQSFPVNVDKICNNLECMLEYLDESDNFDIAYEILNTLHSEVFNEIYMKGGISELIVSPEEYSIGIDLSNIKTVDDINNLGEIFDIDVFDDYFDSENLKWKNEVKFMSSKIIDALKAIIEHFESEKEYTLTDFNHRFEALKRMGIKRVMVEVI